jgi:hypothetical protein
MIEDNVYVISSMDFLTNKLELIAVTDNLNEWLVDWNNQRDEEDHEEIDDFEVEVLTYYRYNRLFIPKK